MNQDMHVNEEVDIHNMTVVDFVPRLKRAVRTYATKEHCLDLYRAEKGQNPGLNLSFWCGVNGIGFSTYKWMCDQLEVVADINQERTA